MELDLSEKNSVAVDFKIWFYGKKSLQDGQHTFPSNERNLATFINTDATASESKSLF